MHDMDRRSAIGHLAGMTGSVWFGADAVARATSHTGGAARPDPLDRELVKKFVGVAHSDLEAVKQMLAAEPHLVNATWDWGGGDFETALGGASHMARPDIARFLLDSGARMDVFCATIMGKVEVVRTCIADNPAIVHVKGPHGITLVRHAELAKQDAVLTLLKSAGAT